MNDKTRISSDTLVSREKNTASKLRQYFAAIVATVGGFGAGTILGWSSPTQSRLVTDEEYGFPISKTWFSAISSIIAIGALIATPFTGYIVDNYGRKQTMWLLCIPSLIGWGCIIWAESEIMFCVGRLICGISAGGWCVVVPLYTNEFSTVDLRGTLGTFFQLQIASGILYIYIVGTFVSVFWLSVSCAAIVIGYAVLLIFLPESPTFFIIKGEIEKAKSSMQWFRGRDYNIDSEIQVLKTSNDEIVSNAVPLLTAFSTPVAKKGLILGIGMMFFQQFSGVNGIIFYTATIFKESGSTLDSHYQTIIVGIVMVISTLISSCLIERFGRRVLLLYSVIFMMVPSIGLSIYFYCDTHGFNTRAFGLFPIACMGLFLISFSVGFGPIPWLYLSEIYSKQIAGYACSIACLFNWLFVFLVTMLFPLVSDYIGFAISFGIFSIISLVGIFFVILLVAETKGKTLEEMQLILGGQPSSPSEKTAQMENGDKRYNH